MSKYYGQIGFTITEETDPGVWTQSVIERSYYGDLVKNYSRNEGNGVINLGIDISNQISIIADPFAYENFQHMKYVRFMGTEWNIKSVEVQYPRLLLSIGGVYNGEVSQTGTSQETG